MFGQTKRISFKDSKRIRFMSEKFYKWIKEIDLDGYQLNDAAGFGWRACKNEVIRILKENTKNPKFNYSDIGNAVEEIEKL